MAWRIFITIYCSGYHYCKTSFSKARTQVLCRFKSCLRRVGYLLYHKNHTTKKNTSSSSLSKWLWPQKKIHHLHHYQSDFESSIGPTVDSDNGNEPTNGDKWTDKWLWTLTKVGARQRVLLTPFLQLPSFSPSVLQSLLKRYAAFRMYKEDLVIEEYSASHRLGVSWKSICANEHCKLEK